MTYSEFTYTQAHIDSNTQTHTHTYTIFSSTSLFSFCFQRSWFSLTLWYLIPKYFSLLHYFVCIPFSISAILIFLCCILSLFCLSFFFLFSFVTTESPDKSASEIPFSLLHNQSFSQIPLFSNIEYTVKNITKHRHNSLWKRLLCNYYSRNHCTCAFSCEHRGKKYSL